MQVPFEVAPIKGLLGLRQVDHLGVSPPHQRRQAYGDRPQQVVAELAPVRLVDPLEPSRSTSRTATAVCVR